MTVNVYSLFVVNSASRILQIGLEVAQALGLPVTSWRTGDPTRSLYKYCATVLAAHDSHVAEYIKAGWLSTAVAAAKETGDTNWLQVLALEVFGVTAAESTFATPTVTVTNQGGGHYPLEPNDITFKSSVSGKTYHNTNTITVPSGPSPTEYVIELEADEGGSDSNVAEDEIDELVSARPGITIVSSTASFGLDAMDPDSISDQCLASRGMLSPDGARDAYEFVCRNAELTLTSEITRATSSNSSADGSITVYVASPNGVVTQDSVDAALAACVKWCNPLTFSVGVFSAAALPINVTATVTGVNIPANYAELAEGAIVTYLAAVKIGGVVATSAIIAAIHKAIPQATIVTLTLPTASLELEVYQVPTLGILTISEV